MILAVVAAVEQRHALPPELQEFVYFQQYGLPPLAGGLRDQPLGWLDRNSQLHAALVAWRDYRAGPKTADWKSTYPQRWKIAKYIRKLKHG
jgi:hypothetical protein